MVIAGHNHQQLVEVLGNTTYLTPDAIKDGENNASYLIMNIECNKTDYRFVYL